YLSAVPAGGVSDVSRCPFRHIQLGRLHIRHAKHFSVSNLHGPQQLLHAFRAGALQRILDRYGWFIRIHQPVANLGLSVEAAAAVARLIRLGGRVMTVSGAARWSIA